MATATNRAGAAHTSKSHNRLQWTVALPGPGSPRKIHLKFPQSPLKSALILMRPPKSRTIPNSSGGEGQYSLEVERQLVRVD
eukprot:6851068-Pyramimonas_sp.AAC.1